MTTRVLAEHDLRGFLADGGRVDDLVGLAVLHHAVLVDARLVLERVPADDRLVELHRVPGEPGDQARRARQLFAVDGRLDVAEVVAARAQRHHDLFQRGVAGALAEPVDRALHLTGTRGDARQRVRDREAEVVVAVCRHDELAVHVVDDVADELGELLGHAVPDGVGDVQRGRAVVDRELADLDHEVDVGAAAVFGRELDVFAVAAGTGDPARGFLLHLVGRHPELLLHVDRPTSR